MKHLRKNRADQTRRRLAQAQAPVCHRQLSAEFAEIFTGRPGQYVKLEDTVKGFKMILSGELDHMNEQSFYMVGTIEEAIAKDKEQKEKDNA